MKRTSYPSRDYQIEEMTRGIQLPIPPMQRRHLQVIAEFLTAAWNSLMKTQEKILLTKEEVEINTLMKSCLDNIRPEKRDWSMLVSAVNRGAESINYNGSALENRPDLSLHLTNGFSRFPLIIECKLIDKKKKKGADLYCKDGLARFIDGEYAWYAHEAFMLAYVRDGATTGNCIKPYLDRKSKKEPDPFLTKQLPQPEPFSVQDLATSCHERRFPKNPGAIDIWHLWLS